MTSIPALVDVDAALSEAENADSLTSILQYVVGLAHGLIAAVAVETNFAAGKTGAKTVLRGSTDTCRCVVTSWYMDMLSCVYLCLVVALLA